jgi:phosphoribosylamine--glycine ligase
MRLESDLYELCLAAVDGGLADAGARWDPRAAVGVVMAAGGYPGEVRKGDAIEGLDGLDSDTVKVFHAGTSLEDGTVVTSGGRVLCVTALGDSVGRARHEAYDAVARIRFRDARYRTDIGYRAVARERG